MMMINLKPPDQPAAFWQERYLYLFAALFIIVIHVVWGFLLYQEHRLESDLYQIRHQHELFKPTLSQLHYVDMKQQEIVTRQEVLLTLTQERFPLHAGIARIGAVIPDGVWLTELKSDGKVLKVSGAAQTYPEVAGFLEKIQQDALFTNFSLTKTEHDQINTNFEFAVQFREL